MVAKDKDGLNIKVPGLLLTSLNEVRRFTNALKQIALKKEKDLHEDTMNYNSLETIENLKNYNVLIELE
jgi:hypothetical protein